MTEDLSTVRSYRSGGWFGIFGEHASVLLPPSEKARVAALWELVDAGSDFNELLDALIASGLRGLPGFVLISSGAEPTRVTPRSGSCPRRSTPEDRTTPPPWWSMWWDWRSPGRRTTRAPSR